MSEQIPFKPVNGKVLVKQLPYKPSKILEVFTIDKAYENEGIVVAVSDCRYGRKLRRDNKGRVVGWEHDGSVLPHNVKVGDRVVFPGKYQDDDTLTLNGEKHRCIDSWEIQGIIEADQPEGFDHPITGEKITEQHPILTH